MSSMEKSEGARVAARPKRNRLWIAAIALALVVLLGLGAYFLFFADSQAGMTDEEKIVDMYNRFMAALKKGDINGMTACAPPDRYSNEFLLVFELVTDFRGFIEDGLYHVQGVDLTNDSSMVKSFVEAVDLDYRIRLGEKIVFDPSEAREWATLYLTQAITIDGETSYFPVYFTMVNLNHKWYIGYAQFIGTEETRARRLVGRFVDALKAGDIEAMRACYAEGVLQEDSIPLFETVGALKVALAEGYYGELDIDYTNDNAMLRSLVKALELDFIVEAEMAFSQEFEEETAKLYVIEVFAKDGEQALNSTFFNLVRRDKVWYLTFEDLGEEAEF
ncbi:MAG: hypothetical protein FWE59_02515 [Oscillospiraceae bacterium]|nr:hypothetical protein [Oscillospiraceae bacterium]